MCRTVCTARHLPYGISFIVIAIPNSTESAVDQTDHTPLMTTTKTNGEETDADETDTDADPVPWRKQSRSETGQWGSELTVENLRAYLKEDPPGAGTGEIADEFGVSSDTVRRRCRELVREGEIIERPTGPSIFWQVVHWDRGSEG